jgi:hypothetical protein
MSVLPNSKQSVTAAGSSSAPVLVATDSVSVVVEKLKSPPLPQQQQHEATVAQLETISANSSPKKKTRKSLLTQQASSGKLPSDAKIIEEKGEIAGEDDVAALPPPSNPVSSLPRKGSVRRSVRGREEQSEVAKEDEVRPRFHFNDVSETSTS